MPDLFFCLSQSLHTFLSHSLSTSIPPRPTHTHLVAKLSPLQIINSMKVSILNVICVPVRVLMGFVFQKLSHPYLLLFEVSTVSFWILKITIFLFSHVLSLFV